MALKCILIVAYISINCLELSASSVNYENYAVFNQNSIGSTSDVIPFLVIPGTKWCGPGNETSDINDLGSLPVDKCCRDHDNCFEVIQASETKYGLYNPEIFTRLHCDCEQLFINCIKQLDSFSASLIGRAYFAYQKYCYKYEYPIVKCTAYQKGLILSNRCIRYKLDEGKPKQWQWFENPYFSLS